MKLKELRKQKKLTQVEIAKILNMAQTTYAGYETEQREPSIDTLKQIADFYNVSLDYLCEHETKGNIDTSTFSDLKKGCIYVLDKLNENNTAMVFGYMTHILQEQDK